MTSTSTALRILYNRLRFRIYLRRLLPTVSSEQDTSPILCRHRNNIVILISSNRYSFRSPSSELRSWFLDLDKLKYLKMVIK
ncbi:hypothetical protein M5689_019667 [Euphorbia peplus]|nr:hypothetical protein M5689_019667 [Euphorbia peplus]